MTDTLSSTLAQDYAAALDWWREAGVEFDYSDAPKGWLQAPEGEAEAPSPPLPRAVTAKAVRGAAAERPPLGGDASGWPGDLAAFREFWLTDPSLDDGPVRGRVAPEGPAQASLMLLLPMPELPEENRLIARILAAMGVDGKEVYHAAVLVRNMAHPDWEGFAARGLGALTRHHIALAAPRRVIAFGKAAAMFAADCGVPVLAAPSLELLADKPAYKRRFWNAWLAWDA